MNKKYQVLKKKHNLPEFKELDKEFSIGKLEETDYPLRTITNKISERLEHVTKILLDIIQPDSNLANMYEAENFSDEEKKKIFELLKKISYHQKELLINDFAYDEADAAKLIKKCFEEWKELKQEFLEILEKIKESWRKETKSRLELSYFG
ncbi:MAG TPA: hypothetical protein ENL16_02975 [Candidatus Woesearchaeota archaeon]|nr:hypothetical protein [Candidatus Woesearchaeota archaeon]